MCNTLQEPMIYIVIQSKENFLQQYSTVDRKRCTRLAAGMKNITLVYSALLQRENDK